MNGLISNLVLWPFVLGLAMVGVGFGLVLLKGLTRMEEMLRRMRERESLKPES